MARHSGVNEPRKTDRRTFSAEGEIRVVLDDFSRRIPERQLQPSMDAEAFAEVVELACDETRVGRVPPNNRPHVLSDRGTALFSRSFGQYLEAKGLGRIFALPSHPRTNGKIECSPRWAKEQIDLVVSASPGQVEHEIENFAALHSSMQYHEVLASVTPDDVYFARRAAILRRRDQLKTWMMRRCRRENRARKTRTAGSSAAPDFGPQDSRFC